MYGHDSPPTLGDEEEEDTMIGLTDQQFDGWVAALRSGKYPQGFGQLRRTNLTRLDQYCCLGVLAEAVGGVDLMDDAGFNYWNSGLEDDLEILNAVPIIVRKQLTILNDEGKLSFTEIADWLEQSRSKIVSKGEKAPVK